MTTADPDLAVHRTVTVPLPPDRAFGLFTGRMGTFWPPSHSIGAAPFDDVVVEPRAGGRWYERGTDGSQCDWGFVGSWEPPHRLVLVWQLGVDWTRDPDLRTEVEVVFTAEEPGRTRVDLTHHLDGYGGDAGAVRGALDSPGGWTAIVQAFADSITNERTSS